MWNTGKMIHLHGIFDQIFSTLMKRPPRKCESISSSREGKGMHENGRVRGCATVANLSKSFKKI